MSSKIKSKGFKIIAIKPLTGCNSDYLKILKAGEVYYFYNNYKIDSKDKISFDDILPNDFYKINDIDVNISAVVGKNGSGKSTIIELLFRVINNFAHGHKEITTDLEKIPGLKVDVYFHTDNYYKIRVINSTVSIYSYDVEGNIVKNKTDEFLLKDFFYTVAINYSHYAYNTKDLGSEINWLDGLFHKNDGYQTPLVINPMRSKGMIDINNENDLVKSRLIANLLRPVTDKKFNFRKLTDKLEATSLNLTLNKSKRFKVLYSLKNESGKIIEEVNVDTLVLEGLNMDNVLYQINAVYNFNYKTLNSEVYQIALDYIIYKIVSIAIKYDDYVEYFSREMKQFDEARFPTFIKELIGDESHITFKLKQTLNFLRYKHIELKDQVIDLESLSNEIGRIPPYRKKRIRLIELIPPPIFSVDIILKNDAETVTNIEFKKLSSGEKQMIYSVSSLLYHLVNLNSITNTKKRTAFKYVNIVLEEIELYFHPEMQRTYINYIIDSISRIELKRIKSINFCFVTHSPFILSDIPDSNILFLKDSGHPEPNTQNMKTFGGNIHDLLAHSFFLSNGFIGEFAKKKIQLIIEHLQNEDNSIDLPRKETILQEIQIVGEPFLRGKLIELYYKKYENKKRIAELKDEIKRLENL